MSGRLRDALRRWRYRDVEREVDEELAFHFERTIADLRARGRSESAARAEADHRFGDVARYRRELTAQDRGAERERRAFLVLAELLEDARTALRRVRRAPALALAVVATFALGIGANATMFGILDRLLLSPPPHIAEPEDVRRIYVERFVGYLGGREAMDGITFPDYADFAGRAGHAGVDAFAGVAAYSRHWVVDGRGAAADRLAALLVTGSYFDVLGTRPALGRFFGRADDRLGGAQVAVIGYGLWQRRYGGSTDALGSTLDLGGGPYTIIGVAPPRGSPASTCTRSTCGCRRWSPGCSSFRTRRNGGSVAAGSSWRPSRG
ncbi:MAG: ABC transporter permease [Longimicrobiales bacterium]